MTLFLWISLLLHLSSATSLELLPIQKELTAAESTRITHDVTESTTTLIVASIHVNFTSKNTNYPFKAMAEAREKSVTIKVLVNPNADWNTEAGISL